MSSSKSDYPEFKDADVVIMSPTGKIWKLHHQQLSYASPVFKKIFTEKQPARLKKVDKQKGNLIQWSLQMIENENALNVDHNGSHYKDFQAIVRSLYSIYYIQTNSGR